MKKSFIILWLFVLYNFSAYAQNDSLDYYQRDMVLNSTHIFEAEALSGKSYFNKDSTRIFTLVVVQVKKVFRGKDIKLGTIELVIEGGVIGDQEETYSHGLGLPPGRTLVLFCVPSKFPKNQKNLGLTNKARLMSRQNAPSSLIIYADGPGEAPVHGMDGLRFESRLEFYDFLKTYPNITIPPDVPIKSIKAIPQLGH